MQRLSISRAVASKRQPWIKNSICFKSTIHPWTTGVIFDPETPDVLDSDRLLTFTICKVTKTGKLEDGWSKLSDKFSPLLKEKVITKWEPKDVTWLSEFLTVLIGAMQDHRRPNAKEEFKRRPHHSHQLDRDD